MISLSLSHFSARIVLRAKNFLFVLLFLQINVSGIKVDPTEENAEFMEGRRVLTAL